jgi:hypothetical protein
MSIEIADVRARWQNQRQALIRADYNHADEELARVLYFANHHPLISGILKTLRENSVYHELEADVWLKEHDQERLGNLGFSLDETERCAQSLKMLEWATNKFTNNSYGLLILGRVTYGGTSSQYIDRIHSAIENLFDPLYFHIDSELRSLDTLISPMDIVREMQSLVDNEASIQYPETHKLLTDTYKQLFTLNATSSGTSWYQIGFSCRTVLVKYGNEVFSTSYVPEGQEQPKEDDASNKLKWTTRFLLKSEGAGDRYRESIERIIQANWDFVSNIGHRQESVSEKDARLAVIYTYMTISVIDRLFRDSVN